MAFLTVKRSISKARYSFGYNRVALIDQESGKRYATVGGGYDMLGVCLAHYLESNHQNELLAIADAAHHEYDLTTGYKQMSGLYGMMRKTDHHFGKILSVHLDGACGFESMVKIARAAGLTVNLYRDKKGSLTSLFVG